MENNKYFKNVFIGIVYSLIFALLGVVILSIVMSKVNFSKSIFNMIYVIISLIGLMIGSIVAARKNQCKGYLVGCGVGIGYFFVITIINIILGNAFKFSSIQIGRFLIIMLVGLLSGMVGINTND